MGRVDGVVPAAQSASVLHMEEELHWAEQAASPDLAVASVVISGHINSAAALQVSMVMSSRSPSATPAAAATTVESPHMRIGIV